MKVEVVALVSGSGGGLKGGGRILGSDKASKYMEEKKRSEKGRQIF